MAGEPRRDPPVHPPPRRDHRGRSRGRRGCLLRPHRALQPPGSSARSEGAAHGLAGRLGHHAGPAAGARRGSAARSGLPGRAGAQPLGPHPGRTSRVLQDLGGSQGDAALRREVGAQEARLLDVRQRRHLQRAALQTAQRQGLPLLDGRLRAHPQLAGGTEAPRGDRAAHPQPGGALPRLPRRALSQRRHRPPRQWPVHLRSHAPARIRRRADAGRPAGPGGRRHRPAVPARRGPRAISGRW